MEPFLSQVANHYCSKGLDSLSGKLFVFPNRRSLAFFRKYLYDYLGKQGKAVLAPRLLTINDFFSRLSSKTVSDRVSLIVALYESYRKVYPKAESLDDFIYWGDVLLSDFNDIDKYLVDVRGLLANVADLKAIKDDFSYADKTQLEAIEKLAGHFINVPHTGNPRKDVKANFLEIWQILYPLYKDFNERLLADDNAYEGMVYRSLAERTDSESIKDILEHAIPSVDTCVFVGLNALNNCEKRVLKKLHTAGLAEFCWDFAGDFIADDDNCCSLFRRENLADFPNAFEPQAGDTLPSVHVCKIPSATGQAKMIPQLVASVPEAERGIDFAVVLADESMLMSVLNSLPQTEDGINVTMGYPMSASEWSALMEDVLAMQLNQRVKGDSVYFYHKNVHDILSSAIVKQHLDEAERECVQRIIKAAKYYIPVSDFIDSPLLGTIFRALEPENNDALASYLMEVCTKLGEMLLPERNDEGEEEEEVAPSGNDALQIDFARHYYCAVERLADLHLTGIKSRTWVHLLEGLLSGISVPFEGEPLGGLQVMGPLETRALDFKHVVILSSNEGVFPRNSSGASFIPAELRTAFGLPTYIRQDAVWSYYFYRMITRAENVWMLYDSRSDGLNTGEESRFIKQLRYLYPDKCHYEEIVSHSSVSHCEDDAEIPKTAEDIEKIRNGEYSATLLHKYITCPAQFYYSFICKMYKADEIHDSLDAGLLGDVCHDTMVSLFCGEKAMASDEGFDKRNKQEIPIMHTITKEYLQEWLHREKDIRRRVLALIRYYLKSVEVSGEDLVTADIIVRYVTRVIEQDIAQMGARSSFQLLGVERKLYSTDICGHRFKGYLDRIDSFEPGVIRVVDYKTGSDHQKVLSSDIKGSAVFASDKDTCKATLQFYLYDKLLAECPEYKDVEIRNAMYSMSDFFTEDVITYPQYTEIQSQIETGLKSLFEDMENPEKGFAREGDEKSCKYCDFKVICGRISKD